MIVNKYINDLKIEFALSNLDLFILDKIGSRSEGGGVFETLYWAEISIPQN